jgi:hypothetical protein
VIFRPDQVEGRGYASLVAETRASGCLRESNGTFAPKNDCQDDGKGGGLPPAPRDDSWKQSSSSVSLTGEQMKGSSPLSGGSKIESLTIEQPKVVASTMKRLGMADLDSVVTIGGGAVRGSRIAVSDADDEALTVTMTSPIDPSGESGKFATTRVMIMEGFGEGEVVVDYSDFHSDVRIANATGTSGLRVASILKQRMLESLIEADKSGIGKAVAMAVGSKRDPYVKGYRLWPQFGFDAKVPRDLMAKIPDEVLLQAVGVAIPSQGTGRIPRAVVIKNLRQQVKGVTIQQLMQFRDGENWWTENGSSMEMSLNLSDKNSLGYKRFQQEQKKLPSLKKRNEGRSWYPIDEIEARDADCGRVEGGRFGPKNDCQEDGKGGAAATARPPSRAKRESWRKSEEEIVLLDSKGLAENSPVIGGERLHELTISKPQRVAAALDKFGLKDLDTAVKIGGGAIRGADVRVSAFYGAVSVVISSPVDPSDEDSGSVMTQVDINNYGDGLEVNYGGLNTPSSVSDAGKLDAGTSDKTRLRIASLMQERMIESLMAAEKAKVLKATTYAAGMKDDPIYSGYRLWPQFGFDTKLDLSEFKVPPEIVLASFKMAVPPSAQSAARVAERLTKKGYTLQQLISTREGKKWWDENGGGTDMTLDLKDKKSLGYKRFAKLKKILPRLKDRNVAEGRSLLGWLIEEVTRRSISLFGFLGGLADAVERRGNCNESDRNESGEFGPGNDCQEDAGQGGPSVAQEAAQAKGRDVDVMLAGGKRVAVIDKEARDRAIADFKANPGRTGSAAGSTTDLWDREFVRRGEGKQKNKITSTDPVFPDSELRQNGQFVAHESVGRYLSDRHEEQRRKTGAEGPAAIIDTSVSEIPEAQMKYLVDSLTEDAIHAYDVLGVDPGFYSGDLQDTMRQMTSRWPEFADDENAKFIFTTLLAITSTGQGPDANLRDADDLYRMFREHGTVVPTNYGGGARDVTASLKVFQGLLDSFGKDRTRRLLSGYTTAGKIEKTFERLAGKSALDEWRARAGASPWAVPVDSKGKRKEMVSGELKDEIVPVAAIFGPKIGSFNANLSGRHDFLTMDRWLMRSIGRVSGELVTRLKADGAQGRAKDALAALEKGKWGKSKLFGVDKTHGITKAALIRSLKIQARTGVIEENGAAFIWATAAERSMGKVKRPSGGGYGKHEDPDIHDLHNAGNSIFKALILEQQDPKTATARRNIREVFRRVQEEIKSRSGREADIDEIQAALWQYEKRLWKHMGAKTNITENSLFSAAADGVTSGKIKRDKPFTPASRRDYLEQPEDFGDDDFDVNPFDAEQSTWESNFADLGVDLLEVLRLLEDDVEERRNFAALDYGVEIRAADCGRDDGGKFGDGNKCQIGVNINDSEQDFTGQILSGKKTSETRVTDSLRPYVGKTVGIVRTGKGKATLVGTMKIGEPKFYKTRKDFDADYDKHRVPPDSSHYIGKKGKYGYPISDVKALKPRVVKTKGIVARVISDRDAAEVFDLEYADVRSADCGRQDGGMFGDGNTCAKGEGPSNSKGESLRGVRRKSDKTQTKVARKLYQMRVPEKNLKSLVRSLGGKVSNTLVEIESTPGDEGVNVFVRDRDNNETHYIAIGYYGATIYTTETVPAQEVSRIQSVAKEFMPKAIDNRLWGAGRDYPVYVVNSPDETSKQWAGLSAKQRLKKERRSADCGRTEDGKFGPKNDCQEDGDGSSEEKSPSKGSYRDAANPIAIKRVREDIAAGNLQYAAENIEFLMESMPPSKVAKELGFKSFDIDGSFDRDAKKKPGILSFLTGDPAKSAANHLAKLALAAKHEPGLKESSINFSKFNATVDTFAAEAGITRVLDKLKLATAMAGVKAACNLKTGAITVVQDRAGDQRMLSRAYEQGWFSTDDPSHYILHEYAHRLQHDTLAMWSRERGEQEITPELVGRFRSQAMETIVAISEGRHYRSDGSRPSPPPGLSPGMIDRIADVSMYGMTDPLEFMAEYWTGVTLGYVKNDEQMDEVFASLEMKPPKKSDAATARYGDGAVAARKPMRKKRT